MRSSLLNTVALMLAGLFIAATAYWGGMRISHLQRSGGADELAWLRTEFHLTDAEMQRIRALHEGYRPRCQAMCDQIMAKRSELETALSGARDLSAEAREKLNEVSALRAQCQAQMLEHFYEVSRAMPPAEGERYLVEMQRLILGQHEQIERTMSGSSAAHGHH
jgi:Spy/CpxP family protein refolding chaperone